MLVGDEKPADDINASTLSKYHDFDVSGISVRTKIIGRKHIVQLTGFGAYCSTCIDRTDMASIVYECSLQTYAYKKPLAQQIVIVSGFVLFSANAQHYKRSHRIPYIQISVAAGCNNIVVQIFHFSKFGCIQYTPYMCEYVWLVAFFFIELTSWLFMTSRGFVIIISSTLGIGWHLFGGITWTIIF